MSRKRKFAYFSLAPVALLAGALPLILPELDGMSMGAVELRSAGVLHFAPDGTLFLADPLGARVYALDVAEEHRDTSSSGVVIEDVDAKIAAALGTTRDQIRVHDMAAHPLSQSLYFSLTRGTGEGALPLVVRVTKVDEEVTALPLERIRHSQVSIDDAPAPDATNSRGTPTRTWTVTDMALVGGELYVAGLSNEEFASTVRRLPFPFRRGGTAATVEIYHTSHDRWETASPIETLLPLTVAGREVVLAGYTCTPLVVLDPDELGSGKHVRGRTVSEIGGGNRPLDMVAYTSPNDGLEYVLVANSHRTLTRFDPRELVSAPAMTTPVSRAYEPGGVGYLPVSSYGVLQLDAYNSANLVVLRRNAEDGSLEVASQRLNWL